MNGFYALLPLFAIFDFASSATVTDPGSSGGSGGDSTVSGGGGGGSTGAPAPVAPATGGGGPSPVAPTLNWETAPAQFREGYNKLKGEFEKLQGEYKPWQSLGVKPDEVGQWRGNYQQVYTEAKGIADALGIDENEITESIRIHGVLRTLDQLRYEYQQAEARAAGDQGALNEQDLQARIDAAVEGRVNPVLERENQRITKEANTFVENTITQLASDSFKAAGIDFAAAPAPFRDFVMTGVTEVL